MRTNRSETAARTCQMKLNRKIKMRTKTKIEHLIPFLDEKLSEEDSFISREN